MCIYVHWPITQTCDEHIACSVALCQTLTECPGSAKLQLLQDAWASCAGEWKKSELWKKKLERKKTSAHGARVWLTRGQIATKYQSDEMASAICDAKLADEELKSTHTKDHPDAPGVEARSWFCCGASCVSHICFGASDFLPCV